MLYDHEAIVADFKQFLSTRTNFGQRQLQAKLTELEAKHRVEETTAERSLRRLGVEVHEGFMAHVRDDPSNHPGDELAGAMAGGPDHQSPTEGDEGNASRNGQHPH